VLALAWLVFPLVLAVLSLGCGLVVDRLAGGRLPGALLLPSGFAAIVVSSSLCTSLRATAQLASPVTVALAVCGLGLAGATPWRRLRPEAWTVAAAVGVFLVYAAPVLLSGSATFAGYVKLDDTATWFAIADNALARGPETHGLAPSTYEAIVAFFKDNGYPAGSVLPLRIGAKLIGEDMAWLFQPYLAFQALLLALGLERLLAGFVRDAWLRALAVFFAAQPALLYGYSLWGAVKELVTVPLLALLAALVVSVVAERAPLRALVPLAVAAAALLATLNVGGAVWLGLALLPALLVARRLPARVFALRLGAFAALTCVLALPTLTTASAFLGSGSSSLTASSELGNLLHRLSVLQVAGIWPVGDFRTRPHDVAPAAVLVGVVLLGAAWALWHAVRRRQGGFLLYLAVSLVGCAIVVSFGSPWVDAKALAVASPALLLAGLAGAAVAFQDGRRVEAVLAGAAIAGGVAWSTLLAYREAWLAPRSQLAELEAIGHDFAGQGPALVTEFQVYGTRHFLRKLDPEAPSEYRRRQLYLRTGGYVPTGGYADLDQLALDGVLVYRTLVLDRSPVASRPPAPYRLVRAGRYYDVWQRPAPLAPRVLDHLPLGSALDPGAVPSCADVLRLAREADASGGELAAVRRGAPPIVVPAARTSHPSGWPAGSDGTLFPRSDGAIAATVQVSSAGRYAVWLGGSFPGSVAIAVDGRAAGSARHRLEHPGQYVPLGTVELAPGRHAVVLRYTGWDGLPGSGAHLFDGMGPLVLSPETEDRPVEHVQPARARTLCGERLDWIEALAAS